MGKIVEVYYNLHKHVFSIRDNKTKLVIDHQDIVLLSAVHFKVSEAGRQRVIKQKRKNVHAVVKGTLKSFEIIDLDLNQYKQAYYNPYLYSNFIDIESKEILKFADKVLLKDKKIYYI